MRTEVTEDVKAKRHDYARGGFKIEEKIFRITSTVPAALLECGHWRIERQSGAIVGKAKRLACFECENAEWIKENAKP